MYQQLEMQSEIYETQDQHYNLRLEQNFITKTPAVKSRNWRSRVRSYWLEQLVEIRSCKVATGLSECGKCRLRGDKKETVEFFG